jgi:hypothetical protein
MAGIRQAAKLTLRLAIHARSNPDPESTVRRMRVLWAAAIVLF